MVKKKADRKPTWTSLVRDALQSADDFMSFEQLLKATGASRTQLHATLHHLKVNAGAVDCIEGEGHLWWFWTGQDKRGYSHEERIVEPEGSRNRRSGKTTKEK